MSNDETIAAYDEISSHYEEYSATRREYLDSVDQLVIDRLSDSDRLLDIGSGDGRRLQKITQAAGIGCTVAVEPSPRMAELCKEKGFEVYNLKASSLRAALKDQSFSRITALWNVFGHLADGEERLQVFRGLRELLSPRGKLIFDVNNRHNAAGYGRWRVYGRRIIDAIAFDEKRGDAEYDWEISGKKFASMGHLFTPSEVDRLVDSAGFTVEEVFSVNYSEGTVSSSLTKGQLFYVVGPKSA